MFAAHVKTYQVKHFSIAPLLGRLLAHQTLVKTGKWINNQAYLPIRKLGRKKGL
jgi:hypothetical protein